MPMGLNIRKWHKADRCLSERLIGPGCWERPPIELGDDDRALRRARAGAGSGQLWAALEGVGSLSGLRLDVLAKDGQALCDSKGLHCGALGVDAEAGSALAVSGHP